MTIGHGEWFGAHCFITEMHCFDYIDGCQRRVEMEMVELTETLVGFYVKQFVIIPC
jgi:hypothetical protein